MRTGHWVASGVVTLGVGAGLAAGAGVAQADTAGATTGPAAHHPRAAAAAEPSQHHPRDRRAPLARSTVTANSAKAVGSAIAFPSLPSPGVVIQQMLNVATVVVNNTPIRGLLDAIAPVTSSPGVSTVRLPGIPVSTAMSADGTHVFVTTSPVTAGLWAGWLSAYSVTEIDTRTNTIVGIPVAVEGGASSAVALSPDGSRAFVTTTTGAGTRVTVIDTANSGVVNAVEVGKSSGRTLIAPDGNAFVITGDFNSVTITMLNGQTGAATGAPLQLSGYPSGDLVFSGTRAYQAMSSNVDGANTTTVTMVDTADNSVAGVMTFAGSAEGSPVFSPDGTRAAQVTSDTSFSGSMVTLFDPETGAVIGSPVLLGGYRNPYVPALFSDGGDRLNVITGAAFDSRLLTIDTTTGAPVSEPITLIADSLFLTSAAVFGPNGDLLYVPNPNVGDDGKFHTTAVVIDTVNGTVVGSPLVLDGESRGIGVSPDGSRVFQTLTIDADTAVAIIGTNGDLAAPTIPVSGYGNRSVVFSPDESRAYLETSHATELTTAVDTISGAVVGNPIGVNGGYSVGDLLIADAGNRVYNTTHVMLLELIVPIPLPFPIVFGLSGTYVNAIDATVF